MQSRHLTGLPGSRFPFAQLLNLLFFMDTFATLFTEIKLSNILLDGNFEPRVSDFGLAKLISASESRVIYHLSIARLWRLQPRETSTTLGW